MCNLSKEYILNELNKEVYTQKKFPEFNSTSISYILVALRYINDDCLPKESYSNLLQTLINLDRWLDTNTPQYILAPTNYRERIKEFITKHKYNP